MLNLSLTWSNVRPNPNDRSQSHAAPKLYFGPTSAYRLSDLFEADFYDAMVSGSTCEEESACSRRESDSKESRVLGCGSLDVKEEIGAAECCCVSQTNFLHHNIVDPSCSSAADEDAKSNLYEAAPDWIDEDAKSIIYDLQVDDLLQVTLDLYVCDNRRASGSSERKSLAAGNTAGSGSSNSSAAPFVECASLSASDGTTSPAESFHPQPEEECGGGSATDRDSNCGSPLRNCRTAGASESTEERRSSSLREVVSCGDDSAALDVDVVVWCAADSRRQVESMTICDECLGDNCGQPARTTLPMTKFDVQKNRSLSVCPNRPEETNSSDREMGRRSRHVSMLRKRLKAKKLCKRCCPPDCFDAFANVYKRIRKS